MLPWYIIVLEVHMSKTIMIQNSLLVVSKISAWWDDMDKAPWDKLLWVIVDGQTLEFEFESAEDVNNARYDLKMALKEN